MFSKIILEKFGSIFNISTNEKKKFFYTLFLLKNVLKKIFSISNFRVLDEDVFAGLGRTQFLSLADNEVPSVPRNVLSHLSLLRTLDLSRNRITLIDADDFKYNPTLQHLSMAGNAIADMAPGSLPPLLKHLHVGRNSLHSLNRTLRFIIFNFFYSSILFKLKTNLKRKKF